MPTPEKQRLDCRPTPCDQCPWKRDTPPGQFPAERYEVLRATTGTPNEQVGPDAPLFGCHKGSDENMIPCAGWLKAVGFWNLRVRLMVNMGQIPGELCGTGVVPSDLFGSYDEMMEHQAGPQRAISVCHNEKCRAYLNVQTVTPGFPCPVCKVGRTSYP
jgi:hypothetical protein